MKCACSDNGCSREQTENERKKRSHSKKYIIVNSRFTTHCRECTRASHRRWRAALLPLRIRFYTLLIPFTFFRSVAYIFICRQKGTRVDSYSNQFRRAHPEVSSYIPIHILCTSLFLHILLLQNKMFANKNNFQKLIV